MESVFDIIRKKASEISSQMEVPSFYIDRKKELARSRDIADRSPDIQYARDLILEKGGVLGHGFRHARDVAFDAGAIVFCEQGIGEKSGILAEDVLIAGFLHDIKRDEENHPEKAALEVERIFRNRISTRKLEIILFAIRNHEAFQEYEISGDRDLMICSGALYDADKFRWGPDNFTDTIWNMAESMDLSIRSIIKNYDRGIDGIIRIKSSFRTDTGKYYGPEFIDAGLRIGEKVYEFCLKEFL